LLIQLGANRIRFSAAPGTSDSADRSGRMPVQEIQSSSAIERVGYSHQARELSVWFRSERRYIYSGVPAELYDALCAAPSAGRFVNAGIKGRFPCRCEPPRRRYAA
jgi:hypothetical protein